MNPSLFKPSPEDTDRVLHRFADHEVSFHDIADEFKTTVPALVLWLSRPDIAQRIADMRSAGAERTRTIAALYLPRTIPVLMRIIDSHDYDIGHRLDDPRDPATPILKLRERESVRKAITLIYRLANFTDKPAVPRVARTSGLPVRSAFDPSAPPVASASSRCRETSESPAPRAIEVSAQHDFDAPPRGSDLNIRPFADLTASLALAPLCGATPDITTHTVGVAFATTHGYSLPPLRGDDSANSPLPDLPFGSLPSGHFAAPSATSRLNPNTASALLERAGSAPRRSRAGPVFQTA